MHADETSHLKNAYSYELAGVVCTNLTRTCACPPRRLAGVWVKWWDNNIPGNCLMGCPEPTDLMDGLASYTSRVSVKPVQQTRALHAKSRCTDPHTPSHRVHNSSFTCHGACEPDELMVGLCGAHRMCLSIPDHDGWHIVANLDMHVSPLVHCISIYHPPLAARLNRLTAYCLSLLYL
jgi:hypothetical protein